MLEARNARRARRGEPPLDVDAGARAADRAGDRPRAARRDPRPRDRAATTGASALGKPPLDVEAEIEREIAGLADL